MTQFTKFKLRAYRLLILHISKIFNKIKHFLYAYKYKYTYKNHRENKKENYASNIDCGELPTTSEILNEISLFNKGKKICIFN